MANAKCLRTKALGVLLVAKSQPSFIALLRQYLKNPPDGDISSDKEWTEPQQLQVVSQLKSNDALNAAPKESKNNN